MTGWRDIYFPSDDSIPLEGWYIPAKGGESDELVIFNHALPMCRAGFPGHLGAPWNNFDAVEIDFVIQMKHLTDAGYNVLAYDIRNHGNSGAANGGLSGIGLWEWRDCVGGEEVCGWPPDARQNRSRPLQPVHGWQLPMQPACTWTLILTSPAGRTAAS